MNAPLRGPQDTRFYPVLHTAQTGSTNMDVLVEARHGAEEGFTLVADFQTKGRGRHNRTWHGQHDTALLVSVLLRPRFEIAHIMPLLVGLATQSTVRSLTVGTEAQRVGLKWPNDVLILADGADGQDKKIAGILIESVFTARRGAVVAGIGLNLKKPKKWPTDISSTAIALNELADTAPTRQQCLTELLINLELWLAKLEAEGSAHILSMYRKNCSTIGRVVSYTDGVGKQLTGLVTEVLPGGGIRLNVDGDLHDITSGEVSPATLRPEQ